MYAGVLTAGALEYKDKAYGSKWDWIDFGLTVAGAILGWLICGWL
nr:MAG TPA: putative periplasmic lipoprotein [Caudoviricetes sp.]